MMACRMQAAMDEGSFKVFFLIKTNIFNWDQNALQSMQIKHYYQLTFQPSPISVNFKNSLTCHSEMKVVFLC